MLRALQNILIHRSAEVLRKTLDFILPRRCVRCKKTGTFLCTPCFTELPRALPDEPDLIACYEYNDKIVRRALWKLKYGNVKELTNIFADPLAEEVLASLTELLSPPEEGEQIALIPVPLHPARLRERGYNQAELLAHALAEKIPEALVYPSLIARIKNTESQTKMKSRAERERNVTDAFMISGATSLPRICIVVDDIITSGATTRACAALMKSAGAHTVLRAAVAHGTL